MEKRIKAIPTKWKGITYRSRLEARWAVFFEEMKWRFMYEPEGYVVSENECYLPDFLLFTHEDFPVFVEIKPTWPDNDIEKLRTFADRAPHSLLLAIGFPGTVPRGECDLVGGYNLTLLHGTDCEECRGECEKPHVFACCRKCDSVILWFPPEDDEWVCGCCTEMPLEPHTSEKCGDKTGTGIQTRIQKAFCQAINQRFGK